MKIQTISFGLTRNLGDFQSARLDMTAQLEDWEDYRESFRLLKLMVADEIGHTSSDIGSITDRDLKLSEELRNLLSTVRDKRSEVEKLKCEILQLNRDAQRLINFKELVYSLLAQMETVTKGAEDVYGYMGSTARNLNEMEVIWSGLMPPAVVESEEEYDPIPFDNGDCGSNNLVPYSEF